MSRLRACLKYLLYGALMLLTWMAETAFGVPRALRGAAPDWLTVLTVCAACTEGAHAGAALGILAGALRSADSELAVLLAPLTWGAGYLAGRLTASRLRPCLLTAALLSLPPVLLTAVLRGLTPLLWGGGAVVTPAYLAGAAVHSLLAAAVFRPLCLLLRRLSPGPWTES